MKTIRQRLGWKLFVSYLTVIVVGVVSLTIIAEVHTPTAINRHVAQMSRMMGGEMGMMTDLSESFTRAMNEVLFVAASLAVVAAVLVSTFVTRRIVRPIQQMKEASRRIADGRYDERVQVVGQDELADLAHSFNQMADQLSQTEKRRRQLIGDVAHELRTPLSSIKSVLEGLQDGVLPSEPATFLDIQHEVSRLQRLVHDLEELSRAESGQISLELEITNLATFVSTAVERLRLQYEDKGVALRLALGEDLPSVQVDVARMTQVMLNLMGNALQYTPAGGRVTVTARAGRGEMIVEVQDTGIGISEKDLSHVFERFYRADKSRSRAGGGSGIGLTISKLLVEALDGSLTAVSPGPNQGSTFTITLPAWQPLSQHSGQDQGHHVIRP